MEVPLTPCVVLKLQYQNPHMDTTFSGEEAGFYVWALDTLQPKRGRPAGLPCLVDYEGIFWSSVKLLSLPSRKREPEGRKNLIPTLTLSISCQ